MTEIQQGVENEFKKLYTVTVEAAKLTGETLLEVLKNALEQSEHNLRELSEHDFKSLSENGKLDNIEVSADNIADFAKVAGKYDIECFIKQDKTAEKPTYHVFFKTKDTGNFQRVFREYYDMKQAPKQQKVFYLPKDFRKRVVKNIAKYQNDHARREQRNRNRENHKEHSL